MPKPSETATILCDGRTFRNWKSVMVQREYGAVSSEFSFSSVEPGDPRHGFSGMRFKPFDPVVVKLAGITVITGSVTTRTTSMDAQGHEIAIQGRSRVCDLADASVPVRPGTFNKMSYEQIARGLLSPFGIGLNVRNPPPIFSKPFLSCVPQYGETISEMLNRLASMRGAFHVDDPDGNLVVGQGDPKAAPVALLKEGRNIKSISCRLDNQNAWNALSAAAQNVGTDDERPPRGYSATSRDASVPANRSKILLAPHTGYADEAAAYVDHERAVATWNVVQCSIVVQGWLRPDGKLWDVCDNISVISPSAFLSDDVQTLGVQSVNYSQDSDNGTTTTLNCVLPNALTSMLPLTPTPGVGSTPGASPAPAQVDAPDTGMTV